jgi:hypothetical protein
MISIMIARYFFKLFYLRWNCQKALDGLAQRALRKGALALAIAASLKSIHWCYGIVVETGTAGEYLESPLNCT